MKRYAVLWPMDRPNDADDLEMIAGDPMRCDVIVSDAEPQDTGLLDLNGNKLYRMPDAAGCGFDLRKR